MGERFQDLPESRHHENMLYDFYKSLLTERQREIFQLHYEEDYSLAEIGGSLNITPQAVADILKRTIKRISQYEEALGLAEKFKLQQAAAEKIRHALFELEQNLKHDGKAGTCELISQMNQLVDELIYDFGV